jgi:hypothetical protein
MNKVNVLETAMKRLLNEKYDIHVYVKTLEVLSKYEGKKITKREHKKIEADLQAIGYSGVLFHNKYDSFLELTFNTPTERLYSFTLYYYKSAAQDAFSVKEFHRCNTWASEGAPERMIKIEESIKDKRHEKIQRAMDLLAQADEILEDEQLSSYYIPYLYDVEAEAGKRLERYPRG